MESVVAIRSSVSPRMSGWMDGLTNGLTNERARFAKSRCPARHLFRSNIHESVTPVLAAMCRRSCYLLFLALVVVLVSVVVLPVDAQALCGNGIVETGEACDPPSATCSVDCRVAGGMCVDQCISITDASTNDSALVDTLSVRIVPCQLLFVSAATTTWMSVDGVVSCGATGTGTSIYVVAKWASTATTVELVYAEDPTDVCAAL